MICIFIASLFLTLLIVRVGAYSLHDFKTYDKNRPKKSKARTLTGWLRRQTGFDWHHFHFGILLLIVALVSIAFQEFTNFNILLAGVGISMIVDQTIPMEGCYFSKKKLIASIIAHIVIAVIALMIFYI